jgi:hypothetical protein
VIGASLGSNRGFVLGTHGRDHRCVSRLGELNRIVADRAGAGRDEDRAALGGKREVDRVPCRHRRNADPGADVEIDARRQRHGLMRGQNHIFGGRSGRPFPLRIEGPHPFANPGLRDAVANEIDLTSAVAMRNDARKRDLAGQARAALHVGRIDAGGLQFDADFPGPWRRRI